MPFISWLGHIVSLGVNETDTERAYNRLNWEERRRLEDEFISSSDPRLTSYLTIN